MLTDPNILQSIWLTLKLAAITTILLLVLSTPLAWWLSRSNSLLAHGIQVVVNLPLVLPPTVLGFYLLVLLGPNGPLGHLTLSMGWGTLPFTFAGLVVGSLIYSLPFAVQPLQNAFLTIGARPMEVAMTLRASPLDAFVSVILPLASPGFFVAAILSFAHTVGEFGIVLMMGGNIPGATQVVSTQIYSFVESMDYVNANYLAVFMLAFSFVVLLATSLLTKGGKLKLISS
jgi:molybdate transport system permease protein